MMGFWVVTLGVLLLGMIFWGIACAAAAIVLGLLYRRRRRRWMKVAAIVCGIVAAACAGILAVLAILSAFAG